MDCEVSDMATYEISLEDNVLTVDLSTSENKAIVDGEPTEFEFFAANDFTKYLRVGNRIHRIDNISRNGAEIEFTFDGRTRLVTVLDEQAQLLKKLGFSSEKRSADGLLPSPMPGKILDLLVESGDIVEKNQPLVILEAMKMENELKAPADGVIADIYVKKLQNVEKKQPILTIKPRG